MISRWLISASNTCAYYWTSVKLQLTNKDFRECLKIAPEDRDNLIRTWMLLKKVGKYNKGRDQKVKIKERKARGSTMTTTVTEGRRRLRIVGSIVALPITYMMILLGTYFDPLEEIPFMSIIAIPIAYGLITATYWVMDGFQSPEDKTSPAPLTAEKQVAQDLSASAIEARKIAPAQLFVICDGATLELLAKLQEHLAKGFPSVLHKFIERYCAAHCFGLVTICMLKRDRSHIVSQQYWKFRELVHAQMIQLASDDEKLMGLEDVPRTVSLEASCRKDLDLIKLGVRDFQLSLIEKKNEPLKSMVNILCTKIGLLEPDDEDMIGDASKNVLRKINGLLEKPIY